MRKKLVKRAAAAVLSAAVAFSVSSLADITDVSAKAPFVKLNTVFKTLKPGQTYRLKLKNNTLGWKVKKAVSKDSTVCKAVNKKSYVKLTAKGEGRTSVWVTLKTEKRKGASAKKRLFCRVNVKPAESADTPVAADKLDTETVKTVSDQAGLDKALADKTLDSITLSTQASAAFVIPSGEYANVDFIVNAPNAEVENSAVFRSVTVHAIKDSTWIEKGKGNSIRVLAQKARIVIDEAASVKEIVFAGTAGGSSIGIEAKGTVENVLLQKPVKAAVTVSEAASVSNITCSASDTDVSLDVKGTVGGVVLQSDALLNITGKPKTAVAVTVAAAAKGARVKSSARIEVTAEADAEIQLDKGAEGSRAEVTAKTAAVSIVNRTGTVIELKKPDGTVYRVAANVTVKVVNGQAAAQGASGMSGSAYGPSSSGSSSSGNYRPPDKHEPFDVKPSATLSGTVVITGTALRPVNNGVFIHEWEPGVLGSSGVVTEGALKLTIAPIKIPEWVVIERNEDEFDCESEIVWDMYVKGDDFVGHKIIPWKVHIISENGVKTDREIKWYYDLVLGKEKWVSEDGIITVSDWDGNWITQEEYDKIIKPES